MSWNWPLVRSGLNPDWDELLLLLQGVPLFVSFTYDDPVMVVEFSEFASAEIRNQVQAVVDNYQAGLLYIRLWDYVDPSTAVASGYNRLKAPLDVDFAVVPTREFHKVTTSVWKGDILEQVFYAEFDEQTQQVSIPVVRRTYEIDYHPASLMIHVCETLAWYRRDGSLHPETKQMHRYYTGQRYWVWWQRKREQTIDWLRHNVAMAMAANLLPQGWTMDQIVAEGQAFYDDHGANIYAYTSGGGTGLYTAISNDLRTWLDLPWPWEPTMSIREKFLEQITP